MRTTDRSIALYEFLVRLIMNYSVVVFGAAVVVVNCLPSLVENVVDGLHNGFADHKAARSDGCSCSSISSSPGRYLPVCTNMAPPTPASSAPCTSCRTSSPTRTVSRGRNVVPQGALKEFLGRFAHDARLAVGGHFQAGHKRPRAQAPHQRLLITILLVTVIGVVSCSQHVLALVQGNQITGMVEQDAIGPVQVLVIELGRRQSHDDRVVGWIQWNVAVEKSDVSSIKQ